MSMAYCLFSYDPLHNSKNISKQINNNNGLTAYTVSHMHIYIDDYDDVVGSNLMQVAG